MQTVGILPARHLTAGILVDDDDFVLFHDIFDISGHDVVCLQSLGNIMDQSGIIQIIEVLDTESLFALVYALFRQLDVFVLDVDDIILIGFQTLHETVGIDI